MVFIHLKDRFLSNNNRLIEKNILFLSQNNTTMNNKIIAKIKRLRIVKGMNQSEMAIRLNISRAAYQKKESGYNYSWAKYLDELMKILETTAKDFFSDIESHAVQHNNYEDNMKFIIEYLHQYNKEMLDNLNRSYEKIVQSKDEQITLLKELLRKNMAHLENV
jgi:transcriptional regulator with XRE-family HTH domain